MAKQVSRAKEITLKEVSSEWADLEGLIDKLQTKIHLSDIMKADVDRLGADEANEFDTPPSPHWKVNELLEGLTKHLKPIYERYAGIAAIKEARK